MAKKRYPYNSLTTQKFRELDWYYWPTEYIKPFHIIKERDNLRDYRDAVLNFYKLAHTLTDINAVKSLIDTLLDKTVNTKNNTYFAGEKQDLFNFVDYLCISPEEGVIAVQSTSAGCAADHRYKILGNKYAQRWINFHPIQLWTWRQSKKIKGVKRRPAKLNVEIFSIEMFKIYAEKMRKLNNGEY